MRLISGARLHVLNFLGCVKIQEQLRTHYTFKMTLQFERKYSTQGSGLRASCPSVFSPDCGIILLELQIDHQLESTIQPKSRGLLHMECDFAIALPYKLQLQDNASIVEDVQEQNSRTLGDYMKKTSGLLKDQLEYLPASGCFKYSSGPLACSTRGCLRTTRQGHQDYSKLSCSTTKYSGACRMDLTGPTTSVGTRTDYSVGPWDYPACATRHLMA
jgi:hypothetical protein